MARKNLLSGLVDANDDGAAASGMPTYPMRGASKSMIRSIDELAKQADRFLEGETVVEIDPHAIDGSFVSDRMADDGEEFTRLLDAIRERGQDSPVLVRPHPTAEGRFQIVFGHRRVRAARELGKKVRAVVKALDDKAHVVAQGQENSARANLTFIERAMFAMRLEDLGYDREVICSALAANASAISKMVTVATRVPITLIDAIGPAASVGRERWVELSLLVGKAGKAGLWQETVAEPGFSKLESNERFERIFHILNKSAKPVKKRIENSGAARVWSPPDKSVGAIGKTVGNGYTLALKYRDAAIFGGWISDNLDELYRAFRASERTSKTGD